MQPGLDCRVGRPAAAHPLALHHAALHVGFRHGVRSGHVWHLRFKEGGENRRFQWPASPSMMLRLTSYHGSIVEASTFYFLPLAKSVCLGMPCIQIESGGELKTQLLGTQLLAVYHPLLQSRFAVVLLLMSSDLLLLLILADAGVVH